MLDFTEEHQVAQKAIRAWCTAHLAPKVPQLETGDAPPYPLMRELCATFGVPMGVLPKIVGSAKLSRPYNTKTMTKNMVEPANSWLRGT